MAKNIIKADPDKHLNRRLRAALGSILHTQTAVKAVLDQAEGYMSEEELATSRIYGKLCQFDAQCEAMFQELCRELSGIGDDVTYRSSQFSAPSDPQSRRSDCRSAWRDQMNLDRFAAVCRILQGLPGYKLHPSGLAIESAGDLSCLSREKSFELCLLKWQDFLVPSAKSNISPASADRDRWDKARIKDQGMQSSEHQPEP